MARYGKLDGARIEEIVESEASKANGWLLIDDSKVEFGWHWNEGVFIPPPPDDTYTLQGTQWVQSQETMRQRARDAMCCCGLGRILVLALKAIKAGEPVPEEVDDFLAAAEEYL
jgi:hypothetical protein